MHAFEAWLGPFVIRNRWWIIILTLALVAIAGSGGKNLKFTTNYRVFFSPENPQRLAFEELESVYTRNDNVLFVIAPKDGNVFTPELLSLVEKVTERAWQTPYSNRVDSISNFQYTKAQGDDLIVRDLVTDSANLSEEDLAKIRKVALSEPLLVTRLVSSKGHVTAVNITVQLPRIDETKETPEVVTFVRTLADEIRADYPNVDIYLTGMIMMNNAFAESSKLDMRTLVPVSFIVMLIILGLLLRGFTSTFVTTLVIIFSVVTAMGAGGWIGFPLTPPSATSPTVILTIAIANSVHILMTFVQNMRHGLGKNDAMNESLRINLQPVFLASLTTSIGFLTMNFSEVPPFRHLGNFVAIGVASSFIFSVTFLPALMSLLPVRIPKEKDGKEEAMAAIGEFVVRRRTPLLWGMAALIILLVSSVPRNQLNDVFVEYFDETVPFRTDSDFTVENLTGLYNLEYSLKSGEPGGISKPAFQKDVAALARWFRNQPEVLHVNVITDIMKRLNKNMHGDEPDWYRLPEERDLAAQYLLLYEMSLPYGLDLNNQINIDKSATRMTVTTRTISSNEVLAMERRTQAWLKENAQHIAPSAGTGTTLMFANIGSRNIKAMLIGSTIALILISFILIVAFRSIKTGLVSMMPNLVPAAMGFGVWGIFVGQVGLALSIVSSMTLGIVVDDTVHFLSKYLRAKREKHLNSKDAVRYAFTTVGRALLVTSIVLIAGFLVLSLSSFELNSGMGLLTAIVIALALLADFLFLPPLLMKLEEKNDEQMAANAAVTDSTPA
ncbi:MAG: MMPL family transporter [Gammaproteobacteria bacterium]|nr:MAG: MMPL family transporter [Gammaproteobacteria bacterium]